MLGDHLPPQLWPVLALEAAIVACALRSGRRLFRAGAWLAVGAVLLFAALNCGHLAVPPPPSRRQPHKVFGIGLSRTGTTSLTVALHRAGYSTYHALPHLLDGAALARGSAKVDGWWADAYDAQTDIHAAVAYEQLAAAYPNAKFVYSTREPVAWARAMRRFMGAHAALFGWLQAAHDAGLSCVPAADALFRLAYGEGWRAHGEAEWERRYAAHDAAVRHFFREGGPQAGRMLPISFVRGEGWETLAPFLGLRDPPPGRFPKADVFDVSAKAQPLWQLQNLWAWISDR